MKHLTNIPFEEVPRELIEQLNSCPFTYNEYLGICPLYNQLPIYWNFAVLDDSEEEIVAFVWGIVEPLERFIHIVRISILPNARRDNDDVFFYINKIIKEASTQMGATKAFFVTDKPHIYFNKDPSAVRMSEGKLVEVVLNENLH